MKLTKEHIAAFLRGEQMPETVLQQIEDDLDDPESEVSRLSRRSAELTRIAFDPEGPLFGAFRESPTSRLEQLRLAQDLSIDDLVERVRSAGHDLDRTVIEAIESGERELDPIRATFLAPAVRTPVSKLLESDTTSSLPVQLLGTQPVSEASDIEHRTSQPVAERQDLVRELSDFVSPEVAEEMIDSWQQTPEKLEAWLASHAASHDEFANLLVKALAVIMLRKDHAWADRLTEQLVNLAAQQSERHLDAVYLRGRHRWYMKQLEAAVVDLEAARQIAVSIGNDRRHAQALIYLARVAIVSPPRVTQNAKQLIAQAEDIAERIGQPDIELLAKRAEMIRLRVAKQREKAIPIARSILAADSKWSQLGFEHILDSVRVDLGLSLRSLFKEDARQEAESLYRQGIERGRDDSHAGMCLYLLADLDVDRMLERLREAAQRRGSDDEMQRLRSEAITYRQHALELCERARSLLEVRGDTAALQKVNRRLVFLREEQYVIPSSEDEAVQDYAVTIKQITERFLGLNVSAEARPFDPGIAPLDDKQLEGLLSSYFAGTFIRSASKEEVPQSSLQVDDYLRPDSLLCIPWPVGNDLVVRTFARPDPDGAIVNVGWFTIENYVREVRPALQVMLELDERVFLSTRQKYFEAIQDRVQTIDPLAIANMAGEPPRHLIVVCPTSNADWICPIEWLKTVSDQSQASVAALDLATTSVVYASSQRPVFPSLEVTVLPHQFRVFATSQRLANGESLHNQASKQLGSEISLLDSHVLDREPTTVEGLIVFSHSDGTQDWEAVLDQLEVANLRCVVLLSCASTHYRWSQGPLVDGLALRLRDRLPDEAVLVGSRVPVTIDEAARLAKELLGNTNPHLPVAACVTRYLKLAKQYGARGAFEVPWVVIT
ncbi:MAG: hypothetical protein HYV60_02605 [Planctomycetia bacterium]|nr:hypothetical protein [Planctomycetia bacterium]